MASFNTEMDNLTVTVYYQGFQWTPDEFRDILDAIQDEYSKNNDNKKTIINYTYDKDKNNKDKDDLITKVRDQIKNTYKDKPKGNTKGQGNGIK